MESEGWLKAIWRLHCIKDLTCSTRPTYQNHQIAINRPKRSTQQTITLLNIKLPARASDDRLHSAYPLPSDKEEIKRRALILSCVVTATAASKAFLQSGSQIVLWRKAAIQPASQSGSQGCSGLFVLFHSLHAVL